MKKRIEGLDAARALAIIGMIIVNFKIVFGNEGSSFFQNFGHLFEGRASATFVVLAGIGLALMTNRTVQSNDKIELKKARITIVKRATFLFVIGLAYTPLWIADILHFYGIYMFITLLFITMRKHWALITSILLIVIYPLIMLIINYDTAWDFNTFEYANLWTLTGFIRNLFYNGFHPVFPWVSFMLIGLWFGKHDLSDNRFLKKTAIASISVFILTLIVSRVLIAFLSEGNPTIVTELEEILGTSPMPPLPIYMISGSSFALFIISMSVLIAEKFKNNVIILTLTKTGKLALTFYVAHVVVGMGIMFLFIPEKIGNLSIEFSIIYSLIFGLACIIFANIWLKYKQIGPLEWVIRKFTR
jgi:uncharacterized membrane protein YeiB